MTDLQATIAALASPVRREILWMIAERELAAGEISARLDVTPGTVSTHLSALRDAGLIHARRDGTFRYYRADTDALEAARPLLARSDTRWTPADDLPERDLAAAERGHWVTVSVDVPLDVETSYAAFTDAPTYSAWLGVPVTIDEGRFATEMEWGTRVRGWYDVLAPPHLIALRWDFDDDLTPVPGAELPGYVRFHATPVGSRVEVHQSATQSEEAEFLTAAWSMVLGRFKEWRLEPRDSARTRRPKRNG